MTQTLEAEESDGRLRPDVRCDFPILAQEVYGKSLVYLDNAATTQKPLPVIRSLVDFYSKDYANIHRAVHVLSERATLAHEHARARVQTFLNAASSQEIIFVRGTTEAINLVASTFGRQQVGPGDEVLITHMEHHSNLVPWQMLCKSVGAFLKVVPITSSGELQLDSLERMLGPKVKLLCVTHVSNALGTINPIQDIVKLAHAYDIPVLVDGAQAVAHLSVDVQALGCDFYAFSGHKMYGPDGIGVLYGKAALLKTLPPWQAGGDMIKYVTFERTVYNDLPYRFEAGTPDISGAVGLGVAIDYLSSLGIPAVARHEQLLLEAATEGVQAMDGVRIIGTARHKAGVLSFVMEGAHPHDIGTILDREGVAIRTGHHCAQPVMERFGIPATARASFAAYNSLEDVERFLAALRRVKEVLG